MIANTAKIAALAVAAGILAGPVQASTVWHFPYKAAPFAMSHERPKLKAINPKPRETKHRDRASVGSGGMAVAHHKPPYHNGVPKSPPVEVGLRETA
jgi:hypothetical protein